MGFMALLALLVCSMVPLAQASQGDRSLEFRHCVSSCVSDVCGPLREEVMGREGDGTVAPLRLPLVLRMTRWNCEDDCSYHCTHRVTNDAYDRVAKIKAQAKNSVWAEVSQDVEAGGRGASRKEINERIASKIKAAMDSLRPVQKEMVQYYGKWVFIRVLGAQEPLSVLFSLLNLSVHIKFLPQLVKKVPDIYPLKLVYIAHALISANAWIWSAVFHTRDKPWTERMDYFSAGSAILSGFFFTIARLFRLAPDDSRFGLLLKACGVALFFHILYLSLASRFDYSYNMAINITLALGHNVLWLGYSLVPGLFPDASSDPHHATRAALRAQKPGSGLTTPNGSSPPAPVVAKTHQPSTSKKARRRLRLIVLLLTLAASLEVLDFAPLLRALDAHSLWHLSTVWIAAMWYDWIIADAQECVHSGYWIGEPIRDDVMAGPVFGALNKARTWARQHAGPIGANIQRQSRRAAGNIELTALTDRLTMLANRAGFSSGVHLPGSSSNSNSNNSSSGGGTANGIIGSKDGTTSSQGGLGFGSISSNSSSNDGGTSGHSSGDASYYNGTSLGVAGSHLRTGSNIVSTNSSKERGKMSDEEDRDAKGV